MTKIDYRYDECGLNNVILVGLETCEDDLGDEVITIKHINVLHRAILAAISQKKTAITPKELRFIRTELGLTQSELANRLNKDTQTIARWEKSQNPIDPTADTLIRVLVMEITATTQPSVAELASWAVSSSAEPPIRIDASDQMNWKPLAA